MHGQQNIKRIINLVVSTISYMTIRLIINYFCTTENLRLLLP